MQHWNARVGLCGVCRHSRRVPSARDAVFYLCELSATDQQFRKYPALPVLVCPGYEARPDVPGPEGEDADH